MAPLLPLSPQAQARLDRLGRGPSGRSDVLEELMNIEITSARRREPEHVPAGVNVIGQGETRRSGLISIPLRRFHRA